MPVRYDPLLTLALAREIDRRWTGATVRSLGMDPDRHAASIRFGDGTALVLLLDRDTGYVVPAAGDPLGDEGVRVTRFGRMRLASVETPPDERTIILWLEEEDRTPSAGIVLELQTNRWNVLCLSPPKGDGTPWRVRYAMWTRDVGGRRVGPGEPFDMPETERDGVDDAPREDEWTEWVAALASDEAEDGASGPRASLLTRWAWTSALNFDWLLEEPENARDRLAELHAVRRALTSDAPPDLVTIDRSWGAQPYVHALGVEHTVAADTVFTAIESIVADAGGLESLLSREAEDDRTGDAAAERLARRLRERAERESKRVAALERQLSSAGSPDAPRELGQILLARKDGISKGSTSVKLQAFDGTTREIALDPKLDAVGNAERFFEEARRRERALERLPAEIASTNTRLEGFLDALDRLDREGPTEELWAFVGEKPPTRRKGKTPEPERLPYMRLRSSSGLEIRVGRGAKDNDALTFRHSAPDDIWLHASQASGAHVVLRWGRKDGNPPQRDLLEAAVAAAVNSQARHSGTVPVIWTRRKYVRKPRKSPPGTVTTERAQTLMVKPDEELLKSLRED